MSYIPFIYGTVDSNNSSIIALTANQIFTGTSTIVTNYASINVYIATDQSSASNGLSIQFSSDNVNWDINRSKSINIPTSGSIYGQSIPTIVEGKYFRLVYTNGGTTQGSFRLQTTLDAQSNNTISLSGQSYNGYKNLANITPSGSLNVNLKESVSAFGDIRTVTITPLTQIDFVYGINTNYTNTTVVGGSVTSTNSLASITTGAVTSLNSAILQSKKYFKYRDGMGALCRYTALYQTGIANNYQIAGFGDTTLTPNDGYFFGYNGTAFSILYLRNAVFTWISQANWNKDTMLGTGGSSNPSGILLVPTNGNVYQITMAYLGFGNIHFYIFSALTNEFIEVHTLLYANLNIQTNILNPSLSLTWQTLNTGIASSIVTLKAGSGSIFVDGISDDTLGAFYGQSSIKVNILATETNIITIKNNTTINGINNKSQIILDSITFGVNNTSVATNNFSMILFVKKNATVGGTPAFTNTDTVNSISSYDIAGTTVTAATGTLIRSYTAGFADNQYIDLLNRNIVLYPGDTLVLSANTNSASATTRVFVGVNWTETT